MLSFPYFVYPQYPLCEYTKLQLYKSELERLLTFISDIKPDLLHIGIGAVMEEVISQHPNQWCQILPIHVIDYSLRNPTARVEVVIISPNNSFAEDIDPAFVNITEEDFKWTKSPKKYSATTTNLHVNIFCTPMPHNDQTRNAKLQKHLVNFTDILNPADHIQTQDDIEFILKFYSSLQQLINNSKFVVCMSHAVFNTNNSHFNNYTMFSEIKDLFPPKSNLLLCEWCYNPEYLNYTPYNKPEPIIFDISIGDKIDYLTTKYV